MISKEMYELLKKIPRHPNTVPYKEVVRDNNEKEFNLFCEAKYPDYGYINQSMGRREDSTLSLAEKGQAAIEEYERTAHNQEMVEKSLNVSRVAMWAAIGSAIAAIASLIKLLV